MVHPRIATTISNLKSRSTASYNTWPSFLSSLEPASPFGSLGSQKSPSFFGNAGLSSRSLGSQELPSSCSRAPPFGIQNVGSPVFSSFLSAPGPFGSQTAAALSNLSSQNGTLPFDNLGSQNEAFLFGNLGSQNSGIPFGNLGSQNAGLPFGNLGSQAFLSSNLGSQNVASPLGTLGTQNMISPFGNLSSLKPASPFSNVSSQTSASPFGNLVTQKPASPFGNQQPPLLFGNLGSFTSQPAVGSSIPGTRTTGYTTTKVKKEAKMIKSIAAMLNYSNKSLEEMRWEDYQAGDKGGQSPLSSRNAAKPFGSRTSGSSAESMATPSCGSKLLGSQNTLSLFGNLGSQNVRLPFDNLVNLAPQKPASPFGIHFQKPPGVFGIPCSQNVVSPFGNLSSQKLGSPFSNISSQKPSSLFGNLCSFGSHPSFGSSNLDTRSTGYAATAEHAIVKDEKEATVSKSIGAMPLPSTSMGCFNMSTILGLQSTAAGANLFGSSTSMMQTINAADNSSTSSSIRHGISSLTISESPTQARTNSLLTPTQRSRLRMKARGYKYQKDKPKISFFDDTEDMPKEDTIFVLRENPTSCVRKGK